MANAASQEMSTGGPVASPSLQLYHSTATSSDTSGDAIAAPFKSAVPTIAVPVSGGSTDSEPHHVDWQPAFLRTGPLVGLAAVLFAVFQILASYAVLKASDKQPVSTWKYQPSVFLAILVAISNKALAFAVVQGTVITFWLRVLRGTTLAQIQRDWVRTVARLGSATIRSLTGRSLTGAWTSCLQSCNGRPTLQPPCIGMHYGNVGCSGRHGHPSYCQRTATNRYVGPLLQRASTVHPSERTEPIQLGVAITPQLPAYFSGYSSYLNMPTSEGTDWTEAFLPVLRGYLDDAPISDAISGCVGSCQATVQAPVLAIDHCSSMLLPRNLSTPLNRTETRLLEEGCYLTTSNFEVFQIVFETLNGTVEHLAFTTVLPTEALTKTCSGPVNATTCFLVSATGEYDVNVENCVITFADPPTRPRVIQTANNTAITQQTIKEYGLDTGGGWIKTTLSGIAETADVAYYNSISSVLFPGTYQPEFFPGRNPIVMKYMEDWKNDQGGCVGFRDPRDDIMTSLNELMFRTGVYTAQKYSTQQIETLLDSGMQSYYNVSALSTRPDDVFHSNFSYFAGEWPPFAKSYSITPVPQTRILIPCFRKELQR